MKINYLVCDVCNRKIDDDTAIGKIEIVKVRTHIESISTDTVTVSETPFAIERIGKLTPTQSLEKITIDLCSACIRKIEQQCLTERKQNEEKQQITTE